MKQIKILEWDTKFFGIKIAKILPSSLDSKHLNKLLKDLKKKSVTVAYWATDSNNESSQRAAKYLKGILADKKTTYKVDFTEIEYKNCNLSVTVEEYISKKPNRELYYLAMESGKYSRFRIDPNFSNQQFEALYKKWIEQSTIKKVADAVFVIRECEKIIGMISFGNKNGLGQIGLCAVDAEKRGKNYGQTLVHTAHKWFISKGYRIGKVVTQGDNIPACRLYEKCGYRLEKIEYFYHFWL